MKVAHVAVYLDAEQAKLIRWDAQEAVLAADEDLELTQKLHDVNARRLAREAISAKRSARSGTSTRRSPIRLRKPARSSTRASTSTSTTSISAPSAPR